MSLVNSVYVVLEVLSDNWFRIFQLCILCRFGWTCVCAVFMFVCVISMVISSAYVMVFLFVLGGGVGKSAM